MPLSGQNANAVAYTNAGALPFNRHQAAPAQNIVELFSIRMRVCLCRLTRVYNASARL